MATFESTVRYRDTPSLPEEFYRVGDDGSVWSCQKRGRGHGRKGPWRRLKANWKGLGYVGVRVSVNKRVIEPYIHRLVLEAFVGPCPEGHECLHENGIKTDNRLSNLRWGTPKENAADNLRHGVGYRGSRVKWSILTEADIPVIRERLRNGEEFAIVAMDYGVHAQTIENVWSRKSWKHVP